jgi:hypothetical protein
MIIGNHSSITISGDSFPGASFVSALEDYTKRIETSVADVEFQFEVILTRIFAFLVFSMMVAVTFPLLFRLTGKLETTTSYRIILEYAMLTSFIGIIGFILFTLYVRLIKLRRLRRNLETLLWPYGQLLQKLSQTLDHGELDEGTSTLIQLKILEAEVAYSRAKRVISSRVPFFDSRSETVGPYRRDYMERDVFVDRNKQK